MGEKQIYSNCKRFTSHTLPCPYKDNKIMMMIRGLFTPDIRIDLSSEIFEKANKICAECKSFEQIKRR